MTFWGHVKEGGTDTGMGTDTTLSTGDKGVGVKRGGMEKVSIETFSQETFWQVTAGNAQLL